MPGKHGKNAQGKQKAAPSAKRPAPPTEESLLATMEAEDLSTVKRPRTEESKFNKMLYDNLYQHGFTEEEVKFAQSPTHGDYLLDRLRVDDEKWKRGEITKGSKYWDDIREEFRDPNNPFSLLTPRNEDEAEDAVLFQALLTLFGPNKDSTQFEEWSQERGQRLRKDCRLRLGSRRWGPSFRKQPRKRTRRVTFDTHSMVANLFARKQ